MSPQTDLALLWLRLILSVLALILLATYFFAGRNRLLLRLAAVSILIVSVLTFISLTQGR